MKQIRTLFYIGLAAFLSCACVKEVPVAYPREISAEFPSDPDAPDTAALVFLDGIDTPLCGAQIIREASGADIAFFATEGTIEGERVADYLAANCSSWGHNVSFTAGGNGCTASLPGATADSLDIYVSEESSEIFLTVTACGYNFVCGNVKASESIYKNGESTLVCNTVEADGSARWIVLCHAWWEGSTPGDIVQYAWPGYGYNEVLFSKFGQNSLTLRREFGFVSEGQLNRLSDAQASPLRFNFDIMED